MGGRLPSESGSNDNQNSESSLTLDISQIGNGLLLNAPISTMTPAQEQQAQSIFENALIAIYNASDEVEVIGYSPAGGSDYNDLQDL